MINFGQESRLIGGGEDETLMDKILGRNIDAPLRAGSDGKELGDALKKGLFRGGKEIAKSGEKILGGIAAGTGATGPSIFNSLASGLNDAKLRNIQGNLAVTDVATAPFSKGSLVDSFGAGAGGADVNADIREAILLDENRRRRDEQEELRDSLFGLTSERMKLQNAALKRAEKEALANKSKR